MAANPPLNSVNLGASSIADDIGCVALHDLAKALDGITRDYRVIGGHLAMRTLASQQHLSLAGADQRHTRILALMARVLGP